MLNFTTQTKHPLRSQRLVKAMETDTFISVENIFKMPSIDRRNLRLAIEEVKSSFQVPITSFQCLKGNLLTALGDKNCSPNLCYVTGTLGLHVFLYSWSIYPMHLN
jgi:hypothetical protein